jgi:uncharacterized protein (TIGR02271 family)
MNPLKDQSIHPSSDHGTIAAYFRNPADAERAITELSAAGVSKKDIGVAVWDHNIGAEKKSAGASGWVDRVKSMFEPHEREEYASKDGLEVLEHMGIPEDQRRYFKNALRQGGVLLTVNPAGRTVEALRILNSCNGVTSENFHSQELAPETEAAGEQRIHLLGETLRVNKERVQAGSVNLRKEVVTERQNIEVPVTREELVIERTPGEGREATGEILEEGKQIKVPLSEERVQVEKRPVVREEVAVRKRQVQDTRKVNDEVKREELHVDKEGDVSLDSPPKRKLA